MGTFAKRREEAEKAGLLGSGDYLKLKEGSNRMRLMTECLPHPGVYQGKKTFKWLCYVVDRVDGKVKPFFMAHTIYKLIEALEADPDYTFSELPMPYDLNVTAKGAGTKDVEYSVLPAKKETPLTAQERVDLDGLKPLKELQAALNEKKSDDGAQPPAHSDDDHTGPVNLADVPF